MTATDRRQCAQSGLTIGIEDCDQDLGRDLALAISDLGPAVMLKGRNMEALNRLQRTIATRWCRAMIASPGNDGADATISKEESVDAAVRRWRDRPASLSATHVVLVRSDAAGDLAPLQSAIAGAGGRTHAILCPDDAEIDIAALARACVFLISDDAVGQSVLSLPSRSGEAPSASMHPDMPVCAPTCGSAYA